MIRSDDEADYERMRARFRELCEAAALATDTTVEVTFSGGARTMRNNRVLAERFRANMAAYGIADQGDDPNAGPHRHGQRQLGLPDDPSRTWRSRPRARPATRSCSAMRPRLPRADETTLLAATLVAQTAYELFADPGPRRGRLARSSAGG